MTFYVIFVIAALALWGYGLWSAGFFGARTSPLERRVYALRVALWFVAILIVAWPLELYRASIGTVAYLAAVVAIVALFFGLGLVATKLLVKRSGARGGQA